MKGCPRLLAVVLAATAAACTPPIRQFDLENQTLTCEHVNQYAYKTLRSMGFTITQFEPAAVQRPGTLRGSRDEHGTQSVTVIITCTGTTAAVDASEDGRYLGQIEFKRDFHVGFTATPAAAAVVVCVHTCVASLSLSRVA